MKVLVFRRRNILYSETSYSYIIHPTVNTHYNNIILNDKTICATKLHFDSPNITIQTNQQNQLLTLLESYKIGGHTKADTLSSVAYHGVGTGISIF